MNDHRQRHARSAFTLMELMIVVMILAILASVTYPNYMDRKKRAEYRAMTAQVSSLVVAVRGYYYTASGYQATANTSDTNSRYGSVIRDGRFFNFTVNPHAANVTLYDICVMYNPFGAGHTSTANYTFNVNGTQDSCVGAACLSP